VRKRDRFITKNVPLHVLITHNKVKRARRLRHGRSWIKCDKKKPSTRGEIAKLEVPITRLEEAVRWLSYMTVMLDKRMWWILGIILSVILSLLFKFI
jgi:hypothetical protein